MRQKFNIKVRDTADKYGLYMYQVAQIMNISESSLVKKMRYEWTPEEQQAVIQKIEEYVKQQEAKP